jgi:hypothetical protein
MSNYPKAPIPEVALVRNTGKQSELANVSNEVHDQLSKLGLAGRIKPGSRVAITAGSRGIANIADILRVVIEDLFKVGAKPFIVPAMGSHGGATAEGQLELLDEYGITEYTLGVPIHSSMETTEIGKTSGGVAVHMDKHAWESDAIAVIGRVKNHTAVKGPIQSGLCKMLAVGLGKQSGAETMHTFGLAENIPAAAQLILDSGKVAFGLAIVENAFHRTHTISAIPPEEFQKTDKDLLILSESLRLKLPFENLDVLVVDWLGKNLASAGMDMNVIGLWRFTMLPPYSPIYKRIVVLRVTPESHGNCLGIGRADFTTRQLVSEYQAEKVYWNAIVANGPDAAKIPIALDTEVEAVEVAVRSAKPEGGPVELVRIKDTSNLDEFYVSVGLIEQIRNNPEFTIIREPGKMPQDDYGRLLW